MRISIHVSKATLKNILVFSSDFIISQSFNQNISKASCTEKPLNSRIFVSFQSMIVATLTTTDLTPVFFLLNFLFCFMLFLFAFLVLL